MRSVPRIDRSTADVFDDHLRLAGLGRHEDDIERNFAPGVVLLTGIGVLRGHDGVRRSREVLAEDIPDAEYEYVTRLVDGDVAFLEWRARGEGVEVTDGADSFVVRDGLIVAQTIHYSVLHRTGHHRPLGRHTGG